MTAALDGAPEFLADAVEHLASCLGEDHPMVTAGRGLMASLAAVPAGSVLVTEETLAAAMQRAWPVRRNTETGLRLSAALLLAALRTDP